MRQADNTEPCATAGGKRCPIRTPLRNFSLEGDQVALPKGASAQSHRLNVRWRGKNLTALSQGAFRAYLFPVYTPAGFALTSESPLDHPHHNSLWIGADHVNCYLPFASGAHEEANYNFYVNDIFQGRAPGRILSVDVEAAEIAADHLRLTQTLHWQGPDRMGRAPTAHPGRRDQDRSTSALARLPTSLISAPNCVRRNGRCASARPVMPTLACA